MDAAVLYAIGLALVVAGIIIIVISIILMSTRDGRNAKLKGAGVIMIGSIPIIFGNDKKSVKTVLGLSLVLTIGLVIVFVIYYWLLR